MKANADAAGAPQRGAASVMRFQGIVATGATEPSDFVGCYQIQLNQPPAPTLGGSPLWLPYRFALERESSVSGQNVVRFVTPDGRTDSLIPGATWRKVASTAVSIRPLAENEHRPPVTLRFVSGGPTGTVTTNDGPPAAAVVREVCRP